MQLHAVSLQLLLERISHLPIQQRQHLRLQFDQRHLQASSRQLLHHLQPDESGSDDDRLGCPSGLDRGIDAIGVVQIAERQDVGRIDTRDRRDNRLCAGARISLLYGCS